MILIKCPKCNCDLMEESIRKSVQEHAGLIVAKSIEGDFVERLLKEKEFHTNSLLPDGKTRLQAQVKVIIDND